MPQDRTCCEHCLSSPLVSCLKHLTLTSSRTSPPPCSAGHGATCPGQLRMRTEGPLEQPSETKVQSEDEDRGMLRPTGCTVPDRTNQPLAQLIGSWGRSLDAGY